MNTMPFDKDTFAMIRVLLIDDEVYFRHLMTVFLPAPDYNLVGVRDGQAALDLLQQNTVFDVLLLDMQLPGIGGLELLSAIQHLQPTIPVIVVSGHREQGVSALRRGVVAYLPKPFPRQQLVDTIRSIVSLG